MLLKAAAAALVLAFATPAFAQEPTPIDVATLTCVGPGYTPDGDPFEVLDTLDERSCTKVCKTSAVGCKAVAKAIDKCGGQLSQGVGEGRHPDLSRLGLRRRGVPGDPCRGQGRHRLVEGAGADRARRV